MNIRDCTIRFNANREYDLNLLVKTVSLILGQISYQFSLSILVI